MTRDRRFGVALFVLALGNGMLAFGNYVVEGATALVAAEAFMALVIAALGYTFVYGSSELAFGEDRDRLVTYVTILVAAVGVIFSVVGFLIAVTA